MSADCVDLAHWSAGHLGNESCGHDNEATEHHRRQRRNLSFKIKLLHALLEPSLQVVRALARFLRVEARVGFAGLLLQLQFLGAMIPVTDFFGEAILDRSACLFDPGAPPVRAPPAGVRAPPAAMACACAFCSKSRVIQAHSGRANRASTPGSSARKRAVVEIGRVVKMAGVTCCIELHVEHVLGDSAAVPVLEQLAS